MGLGAGKGINRSEQEGYYLMDSIHTFFKKHVSIAIVAVFIAELSLYELMWQLGTVLHFSFGTSNQSYFFAEILLKVLPALLIAFCIGTLDSLKDPFKNLGKSLLSGAWILIISVLGSIVFLIDEFDKGKMLKEPSRIVYFILFLLMVGLSEELLMRGTITRLLADKFSKEGKGKVITVLIGGLLFGLYHFSNYFYSRDLEATLLQMLATTMMGMLLCAIYVKWGNLLGVILLHAALDFMTMSRYGLIAGMSIADDRTSGGRGDLKQTLISNSTFVIAAIVVMMHGKKKRQVCK